MRRALVIPAVLVVALGVFAGLSSSPAEAVDPVIAAAGDIACASSSATATSCRQLYTSNLVFNRFYDDVLLLGDNQYETGALSDYNAYYDPTWGRFKATTKPAPGNHEYGTKDAAGYFSYFGASAGEQGKGYYSYNVGSWHIIALNSNHNSCAFVACDATSAQVAWLESDLQNNPAECTLAYWHHPRFSSGSAHGSSTTYKPFWDALYKYGADVVLNGHEHNYERFAPQMPSGIADPAGIREFVVGTGGRSHYGFGTPIANSQFRNSTDFGVLELTLHPASYDWDFVTESGVSIDSGSASCVSAPVPDYSLSASPTSQTVTAGNSTTYTISVNHTGGHTPGVNLSASGLPSGAQATFSPNPTTTTSTMTVTTSASTPTGSSSITVSGTDGALTRTTSVTLNVNQPPPPSPDFGISATPASRSVVRGASTTYAVTVSSSGDFSGPVGLSASGLPSGASATFNPSTVAAPGSSTMTVSTSSSTKVGSRTLTISGTSGSTVHSTTVTLVVKKR